MSQLVVTPMYTNTDTIFTLYSNSNLHLMTTYCMLLHCCFYFTVSHEPFIGSAIYCRESSCLRTFSALFHEAFIDFNIHTRTICAAYTEPCVRVVMKAENKDKYVMNVTYVCINQREETWLATRGSCGCAADFFILGVLALTKQQRFQTQSAHFMHFAWHQWHLLDMSHLKT